MMAAANSGVRQTKGAAVRPLRLTSDSQNLGKDRFSVRGMKTSRHSTTVRMLLVVVFLSLSPVATALEVRVFLGACNPGMGCYWDLRIDANRQLAIEVYPQSHQSNRVTLSRRVISDLEALLRREDLFSLPDHLGALVADGSQAAIEVKDGKKSKTVLLDKLPQELLPIWQTDTGATGRAFRVCEGIRALAQLAEILQCPGVPPTGGKE